MKLERKEESKMERKITQEEKEIAIGEFLGYRKVKDGYYDEVWLKDNNIICSTGGLLNRLLYRTDFIFELMDRVRMYNENVLPKDLQIGDSRIDYFGIHRDYFSIHVITKTKKGNYKHIKIMNSINPGMINPRPSWKDMIMDTLIEFCIVVKENKDKEVSNG